MQGQQRRLDKSEADPFYYFNSIFGGKIEKGRVKKNKNKKKENLYSDVCG